MKYLVERRFNNNYLRMKKVIQIVLAIAIIGLVYLLADSIMKPVRFDKEVKIREVEVIQRAKDIRAAQQAYKAIYGEYTNNFDTLIHFVLTDSLTMQRSVGSADDSLAVATGQYYVEEFRIPVIDTIFSRKLTPQQVREFPIVPHSENEKFFLDAGYVATESGIVVPVFELRAPYNYYLIGLDRQQIDNLIDEKVNTYEKYPGIKVGDMRAATNDAGNWE